MKHPLSREEAALWSRLARTVRPIHRESGDLPRAEIGSVPRVSVRPTPLATAPMPMSPQRAREELHTRSLDAGWDRKLAQGLMSPDFTIDLHGASLDAAHGRLDHMLALAVSQGARLVLLITGKPRPGDGSGGRGERRGAIRAKFAEWLAHGQHASRIAAIRPAHPRHGGAGAVYLVLRKSR